MQIKLIQSTIIFIFLSLSGLFAQKPDWVFAPPIQDIYYIGIGSCLKSDSNYNDIAKYEALKNLAESISVTVSSVTTHIIKEIEDIFSELFHDQTRAISYQQLEGYELYDHWQDTNEYWVYYRLAKGKYFNDKKNSYINAISQAKLMFEKGKEAESSQDYYQAITYYLLSTQAAQHYVFDNFIIDYQTSTIEQFNEIKAALLSLLLSINIEPINPFQSFKPGDVEEIILKSEVYVSINDIRYPVFNLPVRYQFIKGSGNFYKPVTYTDKQGMSICKITSLGRDTSENQIKANIDFNTFFDEFEEDMMIIPFLRQHINPEEKVFKISFVPIIFSFFITEYNLGEPLNPGILKMALKNILLKHNIQYSSDANTSDYHLIIRGNTKRGNIVNEMYITYLNADMVIIDQKSEQEIFTKAYYVKGIESDYYNAGIKAYKNFIDVLENEFNSEIADILDVY